MDVLNTSYISIHLAKEKVMKIFLFILKQGTTM